MSGICGFIGTASKAKTAGKEQVLQAMKKRIAHRGPDGEGTHIDDEAALCQLRLAVIGLKSDKLPVQNEDGSMVLCANATIYNYIELRDELTAAGHIFTTDIDSEVLLHGYEQWGKEVLSKLRGMFAFIVWDAKKREAFGARDGFGVKPFYYSLQDGSFIFASEIKSILAYPGVARELNLEALEQYLSFQYSVLPETFFKGIYRLESGRCFTYRQGNLSIERFFDPLPAAKSVEDVRSEMRSEGLDDAEPFEYMVGKIRAQIEKSVQIHTRSDVQIASLLSSGIDSTYMAALAPTKTTYTVGFETAGAGDFNEISFAAESAKELGREHKSRVITDEDYWNSVPKTMYYMDEPLADPSAVALYFLTDLVSQDVKVVFSGEGADEFFGGYPIYHEPFGLAGFQKLPRGLRKGLAAVANAIPFKFKGKSFLDRASKTVEERYISNAYLFTKMQREALLKAPVYAPSPHTLTKPYYDKVQGQHDTNKMQYIDYNFWGPGDIMLKGDRMAMANSVEVRSPLLDVEVFALANSLPVEFLLNDETTKIALRTAAASVLPPRVSQKPKAGFPTPTRLWLRKERWYNKVREAFEGESANKFFKTHLLVKLLDEHYGGKADNSRKIWNVYVFLVWYQVYFLEWQD